jgi:hypothetical protein
MQTLVVILLAFVVSWLILGGAKALDPSPKCPQGYVPSPVNSTWAGWSFNCLPEGIESSLVGVPSNTYVRPMTTIYSPIISSTGRARSFLPGTPAKILKFPSQRDRGLFPPYK